MHVFLQAGFQGDDGLFVIGATVAQALAVVFVALENVGDDFLFVFGKDFRANQVGHFGEKDGLGQFDAFFEEDVDAADGAEAVLGVAVGAGDFAKGGGLVVGETEFGFGEGGEFFVVVEEDEGVEDGMAVIGDVFAVGAGVPPGPGRAVGAEDFIEAVGDGTGGDGLFGVVIEAGVFGEFEPLDDIREFDVPGGFEERLGAGFVLLGGEGDAVGIGDDADVVDETPHAVGLEVGVGDLAAVQRGLEGAFADQMRLGAQGALEEEDTTNLVGEFFVHALGLGDGVEFFFVVFFAAGVATADFCALLIEVVEMLAEGAVFFFEDGGNGGDGVFDLLAVVSFFLFFLLFFVLGIFARAFESAALGEVVEGTPEDPGGDFPSRGGGAVGVGVVGVVAFQPVEVSLVLEGEYIVLLPGVQLFMGEGAHVAVDQDFQDLELAKTAAEFDAAGHAVLAAFGGGSFEGVASFFALDALFKNNDPGIREFVGSGAVVVQNGPAQRIGSQVNAQRFHARLPPVYFLNFFLARF